MEALSLAGLQNRQLVEQNQRLGLEMAGLRQVERRSEQLLEEKEELQEKYEETELGAEQGFA
jgi:hypothetical protein